LQHPFKIAQIGAGPFSRARHAPCLQRLASGPAPRLSLEAICDLDLSRAEAFVRDFGYARAFTDLDRMLEEVQPDLIYCMTPPTATYGVLERVLPRGQPTFTEKPPGITVEQAERLAALAEEYGTLTYVAFNRRRAPGIERLKRWSQEQGPLRYLRGEMFRHRRREPEFAIGTAIHLLDCLRYLGGEVVEMTTQALPYPDGEGRDFWAQLRLASGGVADLAILVDCGLARERYLIQVESALMEVTLGGGYSSDFCPTGEAAYANDRVLFQDPAPEDPLLAGGFLGEHEAFLEAVEAGRRPDCCLQDACHSLRLAAVLEAGYSGALDDFPPKEARG
jgi:predicted dehydrogenase